MVRVAEFLAKNLADSGARHVFMVTGGGAMFLNPEYAGVLLTDPRGKLLLFVAGAMQLMGLAMIRYIINIKV